MRQPPVSSGLMSSSPPHCPRQGHQHQHMPRPGHRAEDRWGEITEVKHRRWYFAAPGVRARHGGSREQGRERDPTVTMTRCNNPPAP